MKVQWRRLLVLCLALATLVAGVALILRGHPVVGVVIGYVGLGSFFCVCWSAFWGYLKDKDAAAKKERETGNCGRPECAKCTKCACRDSRGPDDSSPLNGC